jgi:hypothetical protein
MSPRRLEVLVVLSLVWILVNVMMPLLAYAKLRSQAVGIVSDYHRVREAALAFRTDNGFWPEEARAGRVPGELAPRLEGRVRFERGAVLYDWENWIREDGSRRYPRREVSIGLSLRSSDERLIRMVECMWGGALPRRGGGVTFPIESW